ncbi:MAG: tetratricopeptide repeat protein [Wenzhouxiangella sp.]
MRSCYQRLGLVVLLGVIWATDVHALRSMREDPVQVARWNQFAEELYHVHLQLTDGREIVTEERVGGYAGDPGFYREVRYLDSGDLRPLSRIWWERAQENTVHLIQVFFHDANGQVAYDYLAMFLPRFRNAPILTLVNLHQHTEGLHAFRQFDASGVRIREVCRGTYDDRPVHISLEPYELVSGGHTPPAVRTEDADPYQRCFAGLPLAPGEWLEPAHALHLDQERTVAAPALEPPEAPVGSTPDPAVSKAWDSWEDLLGWVDALSERITREPPEPSLHIQRGMAFFEMRRFYEAIADFDKALEIDGQADGAYYGRGLAMGRLGLLDEAIEDLTVFIERNPRNSMAYTKRGVRYIWKGDNESAFSDLIRAIDLDPNNAEAHDDLGVVYAQRREFGKAIEHFRAAIRIDPTYQKAYHNLALAYLLVDEHGLALQAVDLALALSPNARGSMQLKAEVLGAMGQEQEARTLRDEAEWLPEGNWHERAPIE